MEVSWKDRFPKENRYFETDNGILYCADCLEIMPKFPKESIDLVITDPPYGIEKDKRFKYNYKNFFPFIEEAIRKLYDVMKFKGSIYVFSDYRNVHELKVFVMDKIFGKENYLNNLVWCYKSQGFQRKKWSCKHDDILFYVKNKNNYTFNLDDVREKEISEETWKRWKREIERYGSIPTKKNGKVYWSSPYSPPKDWIVINALPQAHKERRFGKHPTQKPEELIERLVKASSNQNDLVLDCFAGSGTTVVVCEKLNRRWIGIEIEKEYCEIAKQRVLREIRQLEIDLKRN